VDGMAGALNGDRFCRYAKQRLSDRCLLSVEQNTTILIFHRLLAFVKRPLEA
jgi:hypothetical protein